MELKQYKLRDCLILIKNGAVIQQRKGCSGIPITRIETLSNNRFNRDRLGYADIKDESLYVDYILDDCDLLMSHINSREFIGRTVLYQQKNDERIIHGMNLLRIKTNPALLDSYYAYYLFQTGYFKKLINSIRKDAVNQSSITISDICNLKFDLPSVENQKKIVKILKILDQKIELNRKINDNLEAMAKQLYDYWFVQFDFPNEEGKPYKSSGGKMVWNEKLKREIPEGWEVGVFSDIANITMGQSPDGSSYNDKGNGEIFYQGSTDFGIRFPSIRMYTTAPIRFAKKGDILMSVRAPVGTVNIANTDCCIGRGLSAINSKIDSITYIYFVIHYLKIKFDTLNYSGTTFGSITKDDLNNLPALIPHINIINSFESITKPIFDKQMLIGFEIASLTKQRDELLPLLMNGQVSVN